MTTQATARTTSRRPAATQSPPATATSPATWTQLHYDTALAAGWPIATGVIEGACRYLVKDRMDITGARWGVPTAEAILQLRALAANGDLGDYSIFHTAREHQRLYLSPDQHNYSLTA